MNSIQLFNQTTSTYGCALALVAASHGLCACTSYSEPDVTTSELACPDANGSRGGACDSTGLVDNPYLQNKGGMSRGYVNPEWRANARAEPGGWRIASTPTAVWLDRIAAIKGTPNRPMGLRDHLDAALGQGADYIQVVIYDLPGRDCASLASSGELGPADLPRYEREFIDPVAATMGEARYRGLRIINVIEIDSLPNLVTNTSVPKCDLMKRNGGYVQGIAYALSKLGALQNTFNYLDAGHRNWLGWDQSFNDAAALLAEVGDLAGMQHVQGFITNTSNYAPLEEPFLDLKESVGGKPLREAKWISYNPFVDELSFALSLRGKLMALGFDAGIGMLIDTSRNGWGGPNRPSAKGDAADVNTFVDQSRISGGWFSAQFQELMQNAYPAL